MPVNPTSNPNWVNLKAIKAPKSEAQPKRMLKPEDFKSTDAELLAERRRKDNQEYTDRLDRLATAKKAEDKNVIGDKDWRQNLADKTGAIGDKLRVSNKPNFFDDNINPAAMVGNMASSIGKAPKEAKESNSVMPYVTSIGTPIVTGALAGIGAKAGGSTLKGLARQGNELFNPLAGTGNLVKSVKTGTKDILSKAYNKEFTLKKGIKSNYPTVERRNSPAFNGIVIKNNDEVIGSLGLNEMKNSIEPSMISIKQDKWGNKLQDVLYNEAIEMSKQSGKPFVSGRTLLSPEKTAKAHKRFNVDPVDQHLKSRVIGSEGKMNILKSHKDPDIIKNTFDTYVNNPKNNTGRVSISLKKAKNEIEKLTPDFSSNFSPKDKKAFKILIGTGVTGYTTKKLYDYNTDTSAAVAGKLAKDKYDNKKPKQ